MKDVLAGSDRWGSSDSFWKRVRAWLVVIPVVCERAVNQPLVSVLRESLFPHSLSGQNTMDHAEECF